MSGNLPPGVTASDIDDAFGGHTEKCEECGGVYAEDGHEDVGEPEQQECRDCGNYWEDKERERCPECGSDDLGGLPCPNAGMDMNDLEDARESHHAEMKMDQRRLERAMGER